MAPDTFESRHRPVPRPLFPCFLGCLAEVHKVSWWGASKAHGDVCWDAPSSDQARYIRRLRTGRGTELLSLVDPLDRGRSYWPCHRPGSIHPAMNLRKGPLLQ